MSYQYYEVEFNNEKIRVDTPFQAIPQDEYNRLRNKLKQSKVYYDFSYI